MSTEAPKRKVICPDCQGNGYIKIAGAKWEEECVTQCTTCNSQGEVEEPVLHKEV